MVRIGVTPAAFTALCDTLPVGSAAFQAEANEQGQRLVWVEAAVADRLGAMRGPGESLSDVILRLVKLEAR
jgi:hypothetical protein